MKRSTQQRLNEISEYLILNSKATTKELAELTGVSPEMIRKDLDVLEQHGTGIVRVHGGAELRGDNVLPYSARIYQNKRVKDELCRSALNYINDGDTVFIDPSTTALQLGRLLKVKKNITIVTNCVELVLLAAETDHQIILLGGEYSRSGNRTLGMFVLDAIKKMRFNVAVFGSDGLLNMNGVGTTNDDEILVNELVMQHSGKNILMVDSNKFFLESRFTYAKYEDFDVMITDAFPDEYRDIVKINEIVITG